MPVQPQLFPDSSSAPNGSNPHAVSDKEVEESIAAPAPIWLQRLSLFILVLFCVYLGAFVTALPWLTSIWDHNLFFTSHPALWSILRLGAVRGVISGFGLLDIWIGISEAIHYHDQRS